MKFLRFMMLLTLVIGDDVNDIVTVSGLLGKTVKLPCDTSPPSSHNPLLLTVWFKDKIQDPIYRLVTCNDNGLNNPTLS